MKHLYHRVDVVELNFLSRVANKVLNCRLYYFIERVSITYRRSVNARNAVKEISFPYPRWFLRVTIAVATRYVHYYEYTFSFSLQKPRRRATIIYK